MKVLREKKESESSSSSSRSKIDFFVVVVVGPVEDEEFCVGTVEGVFGVVSVCCAFVCVGFCGGADCEVVTMSSSNRLEDFVFEGAKRSSSSKRDSLIVLFERFDEGVVVEVVAEAVAVVVAVGSFCEEIEPLREEVFFCE